MIKYSEFIVEGESGLLKSLIDVLREAKEPLSVAEIMSRIDISVTTAKNPRNSISTRLNEYSNNSKQRDKNKTSYFTVVSDNPLKFWLLERIDELDTNQIEQKELSDITSDTIIPASKMITKTEKPETYEKSPFGCKQEDGEETSALCILGKSGSGKTTTTEQALDQMGHEYLLYIPIEGEYTFSQYTGEGFEMSSLGEFVMRAQNDPSRCYTVIFDECHRPITISKLNTDLLQALSSRRNRGGERFFTMDRVTKRMYTTPTEEFPIPLKEKSGKILVPDNFGIVCLSSQPAVICRNEDFLNRVDLSVFHKSNRGLTDITLLEKIDKSKIKGTELSSHINALLANEGE